MTDDLLARLAERVAPEPVYLKGSPGKWLCWIGDLVQPFGRYRDDVIVGEGRTPREAVSALQNAPPK